ncbi:2-hexaprenyl-6-methoxy-1,4-benzoquinone methyltransferase [Malassezia pachydermatis]
MSSRMCQDDQGRRTTHFGFQTVDESLKEGLVGSVFSSVASSYDMMNDAMSLGIHRLWKNHFVEMLDPRGGIKCLDVAGGTGDIALRLLDHARTKHLDREMSVTVLDINPHMLIEGQKRMKETMYWNTPQIRFQLGNAEHLDRVMEVPERKNPPASTRRNPVLPPLVSEPVESESMDLYTIAFGIRNCTHIDQVIREAYRVLKPGGIFACLEFGKVSIPLLAQLYKQYSFNVIPPIGELLVGDRDSYQYLVESIERFPTQADFARMVSEAGFLLPGSAEAASMGLPRLPNQGAWEDLTFGIATIWTGTYDEATDALFQGTYLLHSQRQYQALCVMHLSTWECTRIE